MNILFLDDDKVRHTMMEGMARDHDLHQAWTAADAIGWLLDEEFDLVCLDHDLADFHYDDLRGKHEGTGFDVVDWLCENWPENKKKPVVVVHSWNTYRAPLMHQALLDAGFDAYRLMFGGAFWTALEMCGILDND